MLIAALPTSSLGASRHPNPTFAYVTTTASAPGAMVVPLINSGQTFDGETFEGIPDGIGVVPVGNGKRYVDLYVNFEQSHVPFTGFADFEDSSVQRARLDLKKMQLTKLDEVLPASAGFIRFCSAFMAGPAEGFSNYTLFLNEESNDIIDVPAGSDLRVGSVGGAIPPGGLQRGAGHQDRRVPPNTDQRPPQPREHGRGPGRLGRHGRACPVTTHSRRRVHRST